MNTGFEVLLPYAFSLIIGVLAYNIGWVRGRISMRRELIPHAERLLISMAKLKEAYDLRLKSMTDEQQKTTN